MAASFERVTEMGDRIDLVILDMIMPGMDGGKTFDTIHQMRPELPVLLFSGYFLDGQAEQILQRGCSGFMQKPFNVQVLSKTIRHLLDGSGD